MTAQTRRVLVTPAETFDRLGRFQGFHPSVSTYLGPLLDASRFEPRDAMETDPHFKQLIPYVIIESNGRWLSYSRGRSANESRLHALQSLGIGGHVDDTDVGSESGSSVPTSTGDHRAAYEAAVRREILEEVDLPGVWLRIQPIGLINDDRSKVGQVHLGIVHHLVVEGADVRPRESGIVEPRFLFPDEIWAHRDRYETWSQWLIDTGLDRVAGGNFGQRMDAESG